MGVCDCIFASKFSWVYVFFIVSHTHFLSLSLSQYIHKIAGFLTYYCSLPLEKRVEGSRKLGFERGVACAW